MTINKYGVEVVIKTSGSHFGKFDEKTQRFETNVPIEVPTICLDCEYYDDEEYSDMGSRLSGPVCDKGIYFPVRKGTCRSKKER